MKMNFKKGFTLIELLVVVAIIGILASVVLASLNTARAKGADAAVKANLSGIRAQAEILYDNTSNYTTVCTDATVVSALNAASTAGAGNTTSDVCNSTPTTGAAWAASAPLKTAGFWCVDSLGASRAIAATLPALTYVCPAS